MCVVGISALWVKGRVAAVLQRVVTHSLSRISYRHGANKTSVSAHVRPPTHSLTQKGVRWFIPGSVGPYSHMNSSGSYSIMRMLGFSCHSGYCIIWLNTNSRDDDTSHTSSRPRPGMSTAAPASAQERHDTAGPSPSLRVLKRLIHFFIVKSFVVRIMPISENSGF